LPSNADAHALLAGHPNSTAALGNASTYISAVTLAAKSRTDNPGFAQDFTASVSLTMDTTSLPGGTLTLALLGSTITTTGSGFQSLDFQYTVDGNTVDKTFATLNAAQNYFNDKVINLGALPSETNLNISFNLDLSSTGGGDGFNGELLVGVVPEPSTWAFLVVGFLLLVVGQRWRKRSAGAVLSS
jgi:hypothetical protein